MSTAHGPPAPTTPKLRPGGRTERLRQQVVAATTAILAEQGFPGVSIEAVAERSGVSMATIYRRWGSAAQLMLEALRESRAPLEIRVPDSGAFRPDLIAFLRGAADFLMSEVGHALNNGLFIIPAVDDIDPSVREYWAENVDAATEFVRRAIRRGELPPDISAEFIIELASGPLYFKIFLNRARVDDAYVEKLADFIVAGCGTIRAQAVEAEPDQ